MASQQDDENPENSLQPSIIFILAFRCSHLQRWAPIPLSAPGQFRTISDFGGILGISNREIAMKALIVILLAAIFVPELHGQGDWQAYGYDYSGQRHSPLAQINANNVSKLRLAWQYGMASDSRNPENPTLAGTEAVPIMIDGMLYTPTFQHSIVALEPESGEEIWKFDLGKASGTLRGVTYWKGDKDNPPRILAGTSVGQLIALSAKTGKLVSGFGSEV